MPKILIATDAWSPQVNGVARTFEQLKASLEKKGFDVIIVHPGLFFTVPLPFYPEIRISFFCRKILKEIIETEKPDYIHIATEGTIGFTARILCLEKKLKFTNSYHTHFSHYIKARIGFLFKSSFAYLRWFSSTSQKTMVATQGLKEYLEQRGFKNLEIWPLGVDTDFFIRNPKIPQKYKHPVFVYLGRIAREKNVEEFLKSKLRGTKLIIGDGPQRKKLEKKYGKEAVFAGCKSGKELVDLLSQCDVLVFTSRTDTFGLAILEALSCGIPVAGHIVTGPKDIIENGVDGFLSENLAEAAENCLNINKENCRRKAMNFSWEKSADYFIKNIV